MCTDSYTVQTTLQENFPNVSIIFTPTIDNIDDVINSATNGLGFDLVLDYTNLNQNNSSQRKR